MEADFFESVAAAEHELRARLSVDVIRELNKQSAPYKITRITLLLERLAVWVAARRYAGGDIHHYWQQRRKAGIKLLPLLRHHALQLKGVLEEVREARLLSSVETSWTS